jgi:hypothetical protein
MRTNRTLILADGENLILRHKAMLVKGYKQLADGPIVDPDIYVWHHKISRHEFMELIRVSYYTTCVGDTERLNEVISRSKSDQTKNLIYL